MNAISGYWREDIKMDKVNKYELNYHVNANGESEPFCSMLNCYDQICYFEFRRVSNFNCWVYFCDDINLKIDYDDNVFNMRSGVNLEYQNIEKFIIKEDHLNKVDKFIEENDAVMLCTAFNYVPDYVWWDKGKGYLHIGHLTYIIGEDQEGYYIADSPWVFKNVESIRQTFNASLVKIPKVHFAEAFLKYCEVCVIRFENLPTEKNEEPEFVKRVLEKTVQHYYSNNDDIFMGRKAILRMIEKCYLQQEKIFEASFIYHIAVSRRLLLKRDFGRCFKHIKEYEKIMEHLNKSIEYWSQIRDLAGDHLYKSLKVSPTVEPILHKLIANEDFLMRYLGFCILVV